MNCVSEKRKRRATSLAILISSILLISTIGALAPVKAGFGTPIIDGILDPGIYDLVLTDTSSEEGDLPINVYTAFDGTNLYFFFEAISPTTNEQGIGGGNILFDCNGDGYFHDPITSEADVIAYAAVSDIGTNIVRDNGWNVIPESDRAQASHLEVATTVWDTLELSIPRSYADCPWTYDIWSASTPMRNTGWGTTSYYDLGSEPQFTFNGRITLAAVGGVVTPVNRVALLVPYIVLAGLVGAITTIVVVRRRKA